jgi:predicted HTH transcriptional regulator
MNAGLLSEEYALLGSFVSENSQILREGKVLAFESLPAPAVMPTEQIAIKGHVKIQQEKKKVVKRQIVSSNGGGQSDRKRTILNLVDSKGKISIKDATSMIPGVSEKTIQRELLAMVKEGLLLKEGERRWSTYRRPGVTAIEQ